MYLVPLIHAQLPTKSNPAKPEVEKGQSTHLGALSADGIVDIDESQEKLLSPPTLALL